MTTAEPSQSNGLWPTRLYYIFIFAGSGFISPFLNVFFIKLGLHGTEIGFIAATASVVSLIAAPIWTNRNDRWRNPRLALQVILALASLTNFLLSQQTLFLAITIVVALNAFITAGIGSLSDGLALRVSESSNTGYGSIRVFGSLGWMIFVLLAGWVVQQTSLKSSLIGDGIFTLVAALCLFPIGVQHFASAGQQASSSIREVIGKLSKNRVMIGVALMTIIIGVTGAGIYQFQGVYLSQLGAPETIIGVGGMAASVVELPFMIWSDRLTTRWGAYRLLQVAMLVYVAMRGIIFLFPSIPLILIAEAISGMGYSFMTVALVRVIAEQTNSNETRTVLALYTATLTGLVSIASGPLIGLTFDRLGARSLYVIAAVGYGLAFVCLYLAQPKQSPEAK